MLAEERDVNGLAHGLGRLLHEPSLVKRVQLAGRDVVVKRYDIRCLVADLERIFEAELSAA
jgi:hypothetical protein